MEAKRVVKEMNKPQWIPILGLAPMVAILSLDTSIAIGFAYSWLAGILLFIGVVFASRRFNQIDPKFIELFFLSLTLGTEYDPALMEDLHDFPHVD